MPSSDIFAAAGDGPDEAVGRTGSCPSNTANPRTASKTRAIGINNHAPAGIPRTELAGRAWPLRPSEAEPGDAWLE
jgi:hypothetical protein